MRIENHLNVCPVCRSEVAILERFESDFLTAAAVTGPSPAIARAGGVSLADRLRERIEDWFGGPSVMVPVAAAVLLLVLGTWWLGGLGQRASSGAGQPDRVAERSERSSPPTPDRTPGIQAPEPAVVEMAREGAPPAPDSVPNESAPADPDGLPGSGPDPDRSRGPLQIAREESERSGRTEPDEPMRVAPGLDRSGDPNAAPEPEPPAEMLLAALDTMALPDYAAPAGAASLGWMQQFGAIRAAPGDVRVETRAPSGHAGLSLRSAPRLWWSLSKDTTHAIEITIVDDRELDPIGRIVESGPVEAGLHSVDLAAHDIRLEPEIEYRWFVSVIVDANRPSRNPIAAGAIQVLAETDNVHATLDASPAAERGHALARLGLWYDAYDFFASLSAAHPRARAAERHREGLEVHSQSEP